MNAHDSGGPAFPSSIAVGLSGDLYDTSDFGSEGMSLRDYFAAKAMQGITSVLHQGIRPCDIDAMARDAYGIADAMLKARTA
jgi:hypothetical protein